MRIPPVGLPRSVHHGRLPSGLRLGLRDPSGPKGCKAPSSAPAPPGREPKGPARRSASSATANPCPRVSTGEVLRGEAQRIVCMSSTHVALLDAAGVVQRIVGVSGVKGYRTPGSRPAAKRSARWATTAMSITNGCLRCAPTWCCSSACRGKRHGAQAPRAAYPLRLHRRIPRGVAPRKGRVDRCRRRAGRPPRGRPRRASIRFRSATTPSAHGLPERPPKHRR